MDEAIFEEASRIAKRNHDLAYSDPSLEYIINLAGEEVVFLKSASNLNGNLNCSKELEHYAS